MPWTSSVRTSRPYTSSTCAGFALVHKAPAAPTEASSRHSVSRSHFQVIQHLQAVLLLVQLPLDQLRVEAVRDDEILQLPQAADLQLLLQIIVGDGLRGTPSS